MARHAVWKGYLRLSLVNCAVALYPATTEATRIHFHKLNRETGHRLKMHMMDEETGEEVPSDQQARGYEIAKGRSVIIEPEDVAKVVSAVVVENRTLEGVTEVATGLAG